jgi:hypothetical protein
VFSIDVYNGAEQMNCSENMVSFGHERHREKLVEVCQELQKKGFTVIAFKDRIPDGVAFKGQGFLIEVTKGIKQNHVLKEYREAYGKDVPLEVFCFPPYNMQHQRYRSYYGTHRWSKAEEDFVKTKKEQGWSVHQIADSLKLRESQVRAKT